MVKSFLAFFFLITLCLFVLKACPGCSNGVVQVDTQMSTLSDSHLEDTSPSELSQCLVKLSLYEKCCQECLSEKVDSVVNMKRR
jgi:hypothetical protein